ncbi:unnamed protein product, partial [Prunus brigantina]
FVATDALQPSSSALQPPSAAGIAEQPPHDPGTSTALQSPAPIIGAALPRCPAVGAQQQPHHSTTKLAAQPYGYSDVVPVLDQIHSLPPLRSHLTYAPVYASNGALAHMPLGPMHNTLLDPRSQVDLNSRVDQLTQKVDDQNNLIGQLLRQINLNQGPNLGPRDEERRVHEHAGEQFERSQAAASRTLSSSRLGPRATHNGRRPPARSRSNMRRQAVEDSSQTQPSLLPHGQGNQGDRPLGAGEEVSQSRSRHRRRRPEQPSLRVEDDDRRPPAHSRNNTRRQVAEESSQAQSPNLPHGQGTQGDRPLGTEEEVS